VYPAFFALYPTYEKTRQVRALQYSNGIRTMPLWTSYALFDFLFVIVIAAACTIIISIQSPHWFAAGYMFPVLALYGFAATLFGYVVSIFARSQLAAFAYTAGAQGIMFLLSIMTFVVSTQPIRYGTILTSIAH
jgi:ATP-binding cassette, subfamily A (ABC1), member 3